MGLSEGKIPKREPYATHRYQSKRIQRLKGVAPDAVSIQFAARLIGVHSHTVRRWIKWRFLPAYRVGSINSSNYLRVRRDHLLQVQHALKIAMSDPIYGDYYAGWPGKVVKRIQFKP